MGAGLAWTSLYQGQHVPTPRPVRPATTPPSALSQRSLSGPRKAITTTPTVGSTSSRGTPSAPAAIIFMVTVVMVMLGSSPVTDARGLRSRSSSSSDLQREMCNTLACWNLYQGTQDYLNVHIDYPMDGSGLEHSQREEMCLSRRTFYRCLQAMYRNKSLDCHSDISFRSAFNGIERSMRETNCSRDGPVFDPRNATANGDRGLVCTYNGPPEMRFCSMFGDPHIRTFHDEFQTCQIQGVWPLLDNRYLTVQVTNKPVEPYGGLATRITELTVMIKAHVDCAAERFVTYQAHAGHLPSVFDDGSSYFGPEQSVTLREVEAGRHVEIYLRYIDTTVVVRHYPDGDSPFLTVSILMPDTVLDLQQGIVDADDEEAALQELELCSRGCPVGTELIDRTSYFAQARGVVINHQADGALPGHVYSSQDRTSFMNVVTTRQDALALCQQLPLVDMYLDACVFDVMSTGDEHFSRAALDSQSDTGRLHPDGWGTLQNRTTLEDLPEASGAASPTIHNLHYLHHTTYILLVSLATSAFTTCYWSGMLLSFGGRVHRRPLVSDFAGHL